MTDTVFAPIVPAGVTVVTVVELTTLTEVAATPSIVTELVPVKFVPVIVIAVPPVVGPVFGATDEIVGAATADGDFTARKPSVVYVIAGVLSKRAEERT